ncbi:MAG: glycosyltransferase family 2 protein, partial [Bacteroidales bacterium]
NEALKKVEAKYFVLLNSDIEVTPCWIEPVIELMESDSRIAAAQPKLLSFYDRKRFEYAGAGGGFIDFLGYPFCRGRIFQAVEEDHGQYDDTCEIFWASGAALFVRSDLYLKHGGLDEDFFAHMEEIDFCWRMKNLGYKIMYCPKSTVYHIGGGTLPKSSALKTYLNFRNNLSLLYKNLPSARLRGVLFCRFFLDLTAAASFIVSTGLGEFYAVFQAYRDFIRLRPKNYRKRALLVQHKRVPQMYKKSLVFKYYLWRIKCFSSLKAKDFISSSIHR